MIYALTIVLTLISSIYSSTSEINEFDILKNRIINNPELFAEELRISEFAALAPVLKKTKQHRSTLSDETLPLVFLHGMGDSCFNRGMQSITEESGIYMNVYSVCIPTGDTRLKDTLNGFIMSMDESVDVLYNAVKADEKLSKGFNCVGLSQGNNLCRGYIQKYNNPPVNTHLSIHGPIVGVAALPNCELDGKHGKICQEVSNVLAKFAYNQKVQDFLFQADYFRDVIDTGGDKYKEYSEIGSWNNEGNEISSNIKSNFAITNKYAMIKANADTVVVPREGEWFGGYDKDYNLLTMKDTPWYKNDMFGLKTADESGKIFFNSTEGNHLDFTTEQLLGWLDLYC
jgi:palmitoyl-protein thioesterase